MTPAFKRCAAEISSPTLLIKQLRSKLTGLDRFHHILLLHEVMLNGCRRADLCVLQMHVHIAKVSSSLLASLSYAHHSLQLKTPFNLDCRLDPNPSPQPSTRLKECRIYGGTAPAGPEHPKVSLMLM